MNVGCHEAARLNIYIIKYLVRTINLLFERARGLARTKQLTGAWTWNGRAFVKSLSGQTIPVNCDDGLNRFN